MDNDLTPCGDNRMVCVDCYGYGACEFTKEEFIDESELMLLAEVLKETFGIDIDRIKEEAFKKG